MMRAIDAARGPLIVAGPGRGWRTIERYAYVERPYEDTWTWMASHLSTLGEALPGGGRAVELRIRPAGTEIARPVRLYVTGLVCGEDRARAGLEWTDAAHPHLFPHLEGTLEIAPVPHDGPPFTQIGILARYRPPLGPLGAIADRLVGAEITDAALTAWLEELADAIDDRVVAPSLRPEPVPPPIPLAEDPALRRVLLPVDGLAVRRGGAVGACATLEARPGVIHVSLNPFSGLIAVDHDPDVCPSDQLMDVLDGEQAAATTA
jgi:hypothetical protein